MRKQILCIISVMAVLSLIVQYCNLPASSEVLAQGSPQPVIVIDAGHGGEDGGAVSLSGTPESQINLSVALKLEDLLVFYGIPVKMTRRDDISIHDSTAKTLREKKVSDLHNRVSYIKNIQTPVLLSIHQNSYQDSRYSGAQVFFADTLGSEPLAKQVQDILNRSLNFKNTRAPQKIPSTVYLFSHIDCPAVLVECGFLTNPEEELLLRQMEYQKKLSLCLTGAVLTSQNPYDYL